METVKITAATAQEALEEVREKLGPEAVVLNVRQLSANGVAKLWSKPRVEVQAGRPEARPNEKEALKQIAGKVEQLERELHARPQPAAVGPNFPPKLLGMMREAHGEKNGCGLSPAVKILEGMGLLPSHSRWLSGIARNHLGGTKPRNTGEEMGQVRDALTDYCHDVAVRHELPGNPARILVGTPGTGKTTTLCKWITRESLSGNQPVRVWRLDGPSPNTAEFLNVHGELLQVPIERTFDNADKVPVDTLKFVDLPGVAAGDTAGLEELGRQLRFFAPAQVLLTLNVAYDLGTLLSHARFFSALPLSGLVLTHMDEEPRLSKCWNLMLGTQLPVVHLSGGQNVPGDFRPGLPEQLFDDWLTGEEGA